MHAKALLISDVDNTLLGDDEALERLAAWIAPRRRRLALVYTSGRFCASQRESILSGGLPEPDALIGGVGTEIREWLSWRPDDAWAARLALGWDARRVREILDDATGLELQPEEFLSPWKVSYFWRDARTEDIQRLRLRLRAGGVDARLVYSSNRDLDVLPPAAGKGPAAAHVARAWGFPPQRVVVCGDSGNDAAMFDGPFRGIVVANAHEELKALRNERTYHSPHAYAAGVLDGLRYWTRRMNEEGVARACT
jgi:sucrose phosphatase-like protein